MEANEWDWGLVWECSNSVLAHITLKSSINAAAAASASMICVLYEMYYNTQAEVAYPKRISNCGNCAHATIGKSNAYESIKTSDTVVFFSSTSFDFLWSINTAIRFHSVCVLKANEEWVSWRQKSQKQYCCGWQPTTTTVSSKPWYNKCNVTCECRACKWKKCERLE